MQVKLKVLKGGSAGTELPIKGPRFLIGRGDDCHLKPKSDAVSRMHCELTLGEGKLVARDMGSRNGTYVNEKKIEGQVELRAGDQLRVGPLEFEVLIDLGLGTGKQPKVQSVHGAAARTVEAGKKAGGPGDSGIIGQWLQEADDVEKERRATDPETRQFKLNETEKVTLDPAKAPPAKGGEPTGNTTVVQNIPPADEKPKDEKKKEPGKLPPRPSVQTNNSRDAAAEMLKKLFRK